MDYSVSPPAKMYCDNGPSENENEYCEDSFDLTYQHQNIVLYMSFMALEPSTQACLEISFSKSDGEIIGEGMTCWIQDSTSDWDYDGVIDTLDLCAKTLNGTIVDEQCCGSVYIYSLVP